MEKKHKRDLVQLQNPRSGKYVKVDRTAGTIVAYKKTDGPYKNVPVIQVTSR
jgi:hypothetical protein